MSTRRGPAAIPFRVRVGISGHRNLDPSQHAEVATAIREILEALIVIGAHPAADPPRTPTLLTMISPLAEGADRLAAQVALETPGTRLEVPLPFPANEYEKDFCIDDRAPGENAASVEQFRSLLSRADSTVVLGARSTATDRLAGSSSTGPTSSSQSGTGPTRARRAAPPTSCAGLSTRTSP